MLLLRVFFITELVLSHQVILNKLKEYRIDYEDKL